MVNLVERLRELEEGATDISRPWRYYGVDNRHWEIAGSQMERIATVTPFKEADARLLVTLRNALPAIIEVVEAATALLDDTSTDNSDNPQWGAQEWRLDDRLNESLQHLSRELEK